MINWILAALFGVLVVSVVSFYPWRIDTIEPVHNNLHIEEYIYIPNPTLLFIGDMMLGRSIETLMEVKGKDFPFIATQPLIREPDLAIGNFEGIISEKHVKALPFTFQFSIKEEYLEELKKTGFDILSLANNHSFDYGKAALLNTRALCTEYSVTCIGDPLGINEFSTKVEQINGHNIGFIFLHTLYSQPDIEKLSKELDKLKKSSDSIFAYIHWGTEYELVHSMVQEKLAHTLIDNGVTAVIGHHPHVVQDVEIYKERPIFYSLGNFIFDQYFSEDVQKSLGIRVEISDEEYMFETVGLTYKDSKGQPKIMDKEEERELFNRVFSGDEYTDGKFSFLRDSLVNNLP